MIRLAVAAVVAVVAMAAAVYTSTDTFDGLVATTHPLGITFEQTQPPTTTTTTRPTPTTRRVTLTVPVSTLPPVTRPDPTTTTTVPAVTVPASTLPDPPVVTGGVEQWRELVSAFGWNVDVALCLMWLESRGDPNAQNPSSGASGLMQVLPSWADNFGYTPADLFDPVVNLTISYALYVDGGWSHWSPWNRGECH
jgi:hypothetical protein